MEATDIENSLMVDYQDHAGRPTNVTANVVRRRHQEVN